MKSFVWICMFLAATSMWAPQAAAEERFRELESTRFFGRGNTYIAAHDSNEATRGNPATLAEPKLSFQVRWGQLDLFLGENTLDTVSDIASVKPGDSAVSLLENFSDKFGKRQYGRLQGNAFSVRVMSFELSPVLSTINYVDPRVKPTPDVEIYSDTYAGAHIAFGLAASKELFVGFNLRPLHRTLFHGEMKFADVMDFVDNSEFSLDDLITKREGLHLGLDIGTIWTPGKHWRFGMLVENLGYAGVMGEFKDPPPPLRQRLGVGMMYRWALSKKWNWDWFADIQDLTSDGRYNLFRLVQLGTELGTSYFTRDHDLGLMLGVNEGYFTTGAFVDLYLARLSASYYAVELGEYPGQRKDRRFALSLESSVTF